MPNGKFCSVAGLALLLSGLQMEVQVSELLLAFTTFCLTVTSLMLYLALRNVRSLEEALLRALRETRIVGSSREVSPDSKR